MLKRNLRLILTIAGVLGGLALSLFNLDSLRDLFHSPGNPLILTLLVISGGVIGGVFGFVLFPLATLVEGRLERASVTDLIFGTVGLIVGLFIGVLFSLLLGNITLIGPLIGVLAGLVFAYLGVTIAARKREEIEAALENWRVPRVPRVIRRKQTNVGVREVVASADYHGVSRPKILDTSVIIDGRIADIVQTGFLEGPLVIASFVLEELRHIADSSDMLKRNRGRRGLDILNRIQKELGAEVRVYEGEVGEPGMEVDPKLVRLGQMLGGQVVTNDFNLNKVAELQGVPVLNINELANAVKPAVLPGEEMSVNIIKDGKEVGQGVGYLDDGTMIVVDNGKRYIGDTIPVVVTSVLQTSAGRMIFAKPKALHVERALS